MFVFLIQAIKKRIMANEGFQIQNVFNTPYPMMRT